MEWWVFLQVAKCNLTYFSSKVLYILLFSNGKKKMLIWLFCTTKNSFEIKENKNSCTVQNRVIKSVLAVCTVAFAVIMNTYSGL